jgi:bifunctional DNA-binding transcriptional regulator/antitoxin component of YhaV-PrlF toxin-antitoxin module
VTSKLQVTIPKALAELYGIEPGQEIEWLPAGDAIRIVPEQAPGVPAPSVERRLELFRRATERQLARQAGKRPGTAPKDRGWRRDELYRRGVAG